jgi:hypothetical protein
MSEQRELTEREQREYVSDEEFLAGVKEYRRIVREIQRYERILDDLKRRRDELKVWMVEESVHE